MEEKLTKEELEFMQCWYTSECMAECLFSDIDNLILFEEDKSVEVRMGQNPLLSHEYILDEDPKLTKKQNMELKEGSGNIVCLSARNWGKTAMEKIDILISLLCMDNTPLIVTSYDSIHVRGVLNPILDSLTFHPIISLFKKRIQRSPAYLITTQNGNVLDGVNANVKDGQNAGKQFFQKHAKKIWGEEASKETEAVYYKRVASRHALGCVERLTGMSDFSQHSISGKRYYEAKRNNQSMNLPSYINPDWGEKDKQKEIKKYSGEKSIGFRMYVKGEIVTDKISALDMEVVHANCYPHLKNGFIDESKNIKEFEITKKNIKDFKNIIITERPINAERIWLSIDVGRGGGQSEIMIFNEINQRFHYLHNITLYNLMDKPQFEIIEYLIKQLALDFISIDCGEGSIDKDEFVLLKINSNIRYARAKELEALFKKYKNIKVPTWNDGKCEWKKSKFYKHYYKGIMKEFKVEPSSGTVKVTPNHSMLIYSLNGLIETKAANIKPGDWVVSLKLDNKKRKYKYLNYRTKNVNKYIKGKKQTIALNEELGYLIGWAVAEGCSKTTSYSLCLGNNEHDKAIELLELHKRLFGLKSGYININKFNYPHILKGKIINKTSPTETVVFGGGKNNLKFFEDLCGKGSHNKKVPTEILNSPISVQKAFLKGLVEGDGSIRKRQATEYIIKVASEELTYGIGLLLKQIGYFATFNHLIEFGQDSYVISWTNNQKIGRWKGIPYECVNIKNGISKRNKKVYNIKGLIKNRTSKDKINRINSMLKYDFMFRKIKSIRDYKYEDYVYDLMVEDNNTFVAGKGDILIHNTGVAIYGRVEEIFDKEHLTWYDGSKKVVIGFVKDNKGDLVLKDGKPIARELTMSEWSVQHLKTMMYNGKFYFPFSYKLDEQLSSVVQLNTASKVIYTNTKADDHLFDSLRVQSIGHWLHSTNFTKPKIKQLPLGAIGSI